MTLPRKLGAVAIAGFEEFFRDQRPRLFGSLLLITGNSHEADELAQEAFFKLWERWDRVGTMDDPTGYLYRTALNAHRSAYRRTVRAAKRAISLPPAERDPFVTVAARDAVLRALAKMTPRQRAAMVLTELHGFTTDEEVLLSDFDDDPRDDYTPTWSPDGERIAFVRGEVPPGGAGELWVMDADGANAHALPGAPPVDFPSWSPDGSRIAIELGTWPDVRVGVLELATGIVTDFGAGYHPVWSPDSTKLAITDPDGGFAIVDLDDPSQRQIVSTSAWWAAAWSPDG